MRGIKARHYRFVYAERFEPFRIKLIHGDYHDVFDPNTVSFERQVLFIASTDQNWVVFSYSKINSIESLIADYHGQSATHGG